MADQQEELLADAWLEEAADFTDAKDTIVPSRFFPVRPVMLATVCAAAVVLALATLGSFVVEADKDGVIGESSAPTTGCIPCSQTQCTTDAVPSALSQFMKCPAGFPYYSMAQRGCVTSCPVPVYSQPQNPLQPQFGAGPSQQQPQQPRCIQCSPNQCTVDGTNWVQCPSTAAYYSERYGGCVASASQCFASTVPIPAPVKPSGTGASAPAQPPAIPTQRPSALPAILGRTTPKPPPGTCKQVSSTSCKWLGCALSLVKNAECATNNGYLCVCSKGYCLDAKGYCVKSY